MTREERAKQFMPFDAMKGLQDALRDREERHLRVEKHEITEEAIEQNSKVIQKIAVGMTVHIFYYCAFHDIEKTGIVSEIECVFQYLKIGTEKIHFDDIYRIRIIDK